MPVSSTAKKAAWASQTPHFSGSTDMTISCTVLSALAVCDCTVTPAGRLAVSTAKGRPPTDRIHVDSRFARFQWSTPQSRNRGTARTSGSASPWHGTITGGIIGSPCLGERHLYTIPEPSQRDFPVGTLPVVLVGQREQPRPETKCPVTHRPRGCEARFPTPAALGQAAWKTRSPAKNHDGTLHAALAIPSCLPHHSPQPPRAVSRRTRSGRMPPAHAMTASGPHGGLPVGHTVGGRDAPLSLATCPFPRSLKSRHDGTAGKRREGWPQDPCAPISLTIRAQLLY
jgi:hypothetical protein